MDQDLIVRTQERMEEKDFYDLTRAVVFLEKPGLGIRIISLIGYPIEGVLNALPKRLAGAIGNFAAKAVGTAFYTALRTMKKNSRGKFLRWPHRLLVFLSGAVGGFFGFPGLMLELPFSTTLMFRSIADIARREGENLSSGDTQMACITVFALGGRSKTDNPCGYRLLCHSGSRDPGPFGSGRFPRAAGDDGGGGPDAGPADGECGFSLRDHPDGQGGR